MLLTILCYPCASTEIFELTQVEKVDCVCISLTLCVCIHLIKTLFSVTRVFKEGSNAHAGEWRIRSQQCIMEGCSGPLLCEFLCGNAVHQPNVEQS